MSARTADDPGAGAAARSRGGRVVRVLEAELTWTGEAFESGVRVEIDEDGWIVRVERREGGGEPDRRGRGEEAGPPRPEITRLARRALLPGFVNAHSHAFQRGLRGHGETFGGAAEGRPDSFWSWREAMYRLVESVTPERVHELSLRAFREMRRAGITTVGEFHYLHHADPGGDYALDEVVLEAASEVGIRVVLLSAFYGAGGLDADGHGPLAGGQLRFRTRSLEEYLRSLDRLRRRVDPRTQSLGVVAHSIRAVPADTVVELWEEAARQRLPFHMHVEEQVAEVEACRAYYGRTPMGLLLERLPPDERFTAVHATHTAPEDARAFARAGGTVCLCPLTEANLGDGIPDLPEVLLAGGRLALGTDSNARISMLEEMRLVEYAQRLALRRRGVVTDGHGRVAHKLLDAATTGGATSLGLPVGRIEAGCRADFALVDLDAPTLEGWARETLPETLVFGAGEEVITDTLIGGVAR